MIKENRDSYIVIKIRRRVGRNSLTSTLMSVPKEAISIIESHFRYCSSVWGCYSINDINRLQKLPNRAVRIMVSQLLPKRHPLYVLFEF